MVIESLNQFTQQRIQCGLPLKAYCSVNWVQGFLVELLGDVGVSSEPMHGSPMLPDASLDDGVGFLRCLNRSCLVPGDSEGLRCGSPAEQAALGAVTEAGGHLKAPVSGYSIEFLLVAVFLASGVEAPSHPVTGLDSAMAAH